MGYPRGQQLMANMAAIFLDQFTWRSFLGSEIGLPCYRPGEIVFKSVAGWTQMGQVIGNGGTGRKEEFGLGWGPK